MFGGLARGRTRKNAFFYIKYSFKVKRPRFILFTFKSNSMSQTRLQKSLDWLTSRRQKAFSNYCCQSSAKPTFSFHASTTLFHSSQRRSIESTIQQGKAKNSATMRRSRTAKRKAPKTVTIGVFLEKKKKRHEWESCSKTEFLWFLLLHQTFLPQQHCFCLFLRTKQKLYLIELRPLTRGPLLKSKFKFSKHKCRVF